mmetsp:Transcript_15323/g.41302  ORF Transcript_15323/g.41302 Transcript_15323/m.41302 type:complete len:200 (-) Transcript_15323:255-854(-)
MHGKPSIDRSPGPCVMPVCACSTSYNAQTRANRAIHALDHNRHPKVLDTIVGRQNATAKQLASNQSAKCAHRVRHNQYPVINMHRPFWPPGGRSSVRNSTALLSCKSPHAIEQAWLAICARLQELAVEPSQHTIARPGQGRDQKLLMNMPWRKPRPEQDPHMPHTSSIQQVARAGPNHRARLCPSRFASRLLERWLNGT